MEVVVLLKFEVDAEQVRKPGEPDEDIDAKTRSFVAEMVGRTVEKMDSIKLVASAIAKVNEIGNVQIQPTKQVMKISDMDVS